MKLGVKMALFLPVAKLHQGEMDSTFKRPGHIP